MSHGHLNRALTPLERQLRTTKSADMRVRSYALGAVDAMMNDAARAEGLFKQAALEARRSAGSNIAAGRAAVLAREAYDARTSAEVGKYRSAYALLAEDESTKAEAAKSAAARMTRAKEYKPLIEKVRYHEKRRDLMLAAAKATDKALKRIPPLPADVTKNAATLPSNHELLASPTLGWRPQSFSTLTGNFFPDDVRAAASSLKGLGAVDPQATTSAPAWWGSLQNALGFGVKAAAEAAKGEGEKVATSNPTGGGALTVGGNLLNTLSNMIGGAGGRTGAAPQAESAPIEWAPILAIGGVAVGGFVLWKMMHKGK